MLNYIQAQQLITSLSRSFGTEYISLDDADGRVLAEDVAADRDYPPFNRATMDGYAISTADWESGTRAFKVQQVIYAGQVGEAGLQAGYCYKIMTGAPVPLSANAVIRREDATQVDGNVSFSLETMRPYQNIARQGEDIKAGTGILSANTLCTPAVVSLLATLGRHRVMVASLPKVALFTTGDEVVEVSAAIKPHQIRNSNEYLLQSLLKKWLIKPAVCNHVIDDKQHLAETLKTVLGFDIIITCGGVSAGDADYLPEVLEGLGVKKLFHKLSIRPGKPIWCGQLPMGGLVFALPGNPFSCMVTFKLFIEAYLSVCFGLGMPRILTLPFNGKRKRSSGFDEFFPVSISGEPIAVNLIPINTSGDIRLGLNADALALQPCDADELNDGDSVSYLLF
ncbi:molybdopterin molybdotransferase MoeA [Mucilaginibacter paludis]|uniref:Molybdopterin molybdenumtransferase n=1 Tax=Mucilaginibacter paludis DSM 18603 TaxID=714943 RepID=H1Y0U6_9SPHI|nr:molybdopterin molybdotransferase MoeA [Mucilaginibacter paludis]EHQ29171.1 molybdenum cofactor synthesis domain protein [Mucilaginibacter paludis DSM 18603]